jgi:hypothetical protein
VLCAGSALLLVEDESTRIVKRRPCWSVIKPIRITFSRLSALLLIDKPWFLTEGKDLPLCSSYFPLGVSQLPGHNHHQLHASHQPYLTYVDFGFKSGFWKNGEKC